MSRVRYIKTISFFHIIVIALFFLIEVYELIALAAIPVLGYLSGKLLNNKLALGYVVLMILMILLRIGLIFYYNDYLYTIPTIIMIIAEILIIILVMKFW
mmetsp:Transcript_37527/g.6748  ORF Transcript_37527/g.6748 Transcript_37527/m.6748 type:complete len:100 (+) Transcript_37527:183-482(+)